MYLCIFILHIVKFIYKTSYNRFSDLGYTRRKFVSKAGLLDQHDLLMQII